MMLNCPECGLTITATQKECPKCHTNIEEIKEELVKNKAAEAAEKKEAEKAKTIEENKKTNEKKVSAKKTKKKKKDISVEISIKEEDNDNHEVSKTTELVESSKTTKKTLSKSANVKEEMIAAVVAAEALAAIEEEDAAEETLCKTCMSPVDDSQNFCQLCGSSIEAIEETVNPIIPKTDEESNKFSAAIGYIFFFFPILSGQYQKSPFARFHARQAMLLFRSSIILFLVLTISRNFLVTLFSIRVPDLDHIHAIWQHGTGGLFYYYLITMINLLHLMPFGLMLVGMINALQGNKKKLPVVNRSFFPIINRLLSKIEEKNKEEK